MAIATLRQYLAAPDLSTASPDTIYRHAVGILLNGMVRHSVSGNADQFDAFADRMNTIAEGLAGNCDPKRLLTTTGLAIDEFARFSGHVAASAHDRETELEQLVLLLSKTVVAIADPVVKSTQGLSELLSAVSSAHDGESLRSLKVQMGAFLGVWTDDITRHRATVQLAAVQQAGDPALDPATQLPRRNIAEDAIRIAMGVPGRKFLVTAVIDRLQAINARYGSDVGDAVLKELGSHMRKNLQPNDRLFRWNGPTITGLIQRENNITEVRWSFL